MKKLFYLLLVLPLFYSCQNEDPIPETGFFKVFDDVNYGVDYHAIDVIKSASGFIVLAATEIDRTDFSGIQLIKVDEEGEFEAELTFDPAPVLPTGELMEANGRYYFFGMDPQTIQVQLISVNDSLSDEQIINVPLTYPLAAAASSTSNQFLILSYDPFNAESVISYIGTDGSIVNTAAYSIGAGEDVEATILDHYLNPGEQPLPFFVGETPGGSVFFNGFYNYSMSMVFSDFGGTPTGVLQGQTTDGGIRKAMPISGNIFAVGGFQFNDNFIAVDASISSTATASSVDLYTLYGNVTEYRSYTPMDIASYDIGTTTYTIIAAETENRQIGLYIFDQTTAELVGKHNIGYLNPYTLASLRPETDEENHLLLSGTTYIANRFQRIYLNRIPEEEVSSWISQ
ncbi:MAG: hypothetical protein RLO17_11045 [Cyclobacteriaceae bacterium]